MFLGSIMNGLNSLSDFELKQLGSFLGVNIDVISGKSKDKVRTLENYISYSQLQDKVGQWFMQRSSIAISYSYSKKKWANTLYEYLLQKGYNPIIDTSHIDITDRCITLFEDMLSEQPIFLAILNDKYFDSLNCMRELYLFSSKYDFNTNIICHRFISLWENNLSLTISRISEIANNWREKIDQQNEIINEHKCPIREKLITELDWYAKIYHQCINMLFMIKDISAIIIDGDIDGYIPMIEKVIRMKLKL